jgi:hypothetical protein
MWKKFVFVVLKFYDYVFSCSVKFQKSVRLAQQSFGHLFVWIFNLIDLIAESKSQTNLCHPNFRPSLKREKENTNLYLE